MRCILVDNARRKGSLKRGGDLKRIDLEAVHETAATAAEDVLAISEALDQLAAHDGDKATLVKLR